MKKTVLVIAAVILSGVLGRAQMNWYNPLESGPVVHGQGWEELRGTYVRLPDRAQEKVREPLWKLSRNSAGINLVFRSDASTIAVRYQVAGGYNMHHMPSTGVSGVDLYAIDSKGKTRWVAPDFMPVFADTIRYTYSKITYRDEEVNSYEYHLYLPLYNTVKWMEIGVPQGATLEFAPQGPEKPILVYGTSIAQGACASRPGMAWTCMIERGSGIPVVNLGFSGNGRLEPELFDLISEIDASLYIIDCMPNMNRQDDIRTLLANGVIKIRNASGSPILLVEHSGNSGWEASESKEKFRTLNEKLRAAYEDLVAAGYKKIYYLSWEEIGLGMDGMVEGVHPNDLGMQRYADAYLAKIAEILK